MKIAVSRSKSSFAGTANFTAYVTFKRDQQASEAVQFFNGFVVDDCRLKATFGTTKYCNNFLKGTACTNPNCLYLHELANAEDCFTKEELSHLLSSGGGHPACKNSSSPTAVQPQLRTSPNNSSGSSTPFFASPNFGPSSFSASSLSPYPSPSMLPSSTYSPSSTEKYFNLPCLERTPSPVLTSGKSGARTICSSTTYAHATSPSFSAVVSPPPGLSPHHSRTGRHISPPPGLSPYPVCPPARFHQSYQPREDDKILQNSRWNFDKFAEAVNEVGNSSGVSRYSFAEGSSSSKDEESNQLSHLDWSFEDLLPNKLSASPRNLLPGFGSSAVNGSHVHSRSSRGS